MICLNLTVFGMQERVIDTHGYASLRLDFSTRGLRGGEETKGKHREVGSSEVVPTVVARSISMTKPLLAILLFLSLSVSAGELDGKGVVCESLRSK